MTFPFTVTIAEKIETVVLCYLRGAGTKKGAFGSLAELGGGAYEVSVDGVTYMVECGAGGWSVTCGVIKSTDASLLEAAHTVTSARGFFQ